jgi:23S rRNA (cytosine1962-C5)-methyltransferase
LLPLEAGAAEAGADAGIVEGAAPGEAAGAADPPPPGVQATTVAASNASAVIRIRIFRFAMPVHTLLIDGRFSGQNRDHGGVTTDGYELIDAGDGRRLERFGSRVVDRPAPSVADQLPRAERTAWGAADLRFDREQGWTGSNLQPWAVAIDGVTVELRPTAAGQLGLFPEHAVAWPWLRDRVRERPPASEVLHLFAHTGATTLAIAEAGARVTHVDASRPAVAWARRNAELSSLTDRPIRWIVDGALEYARRESRRGRRYAGIILDPPTFGHGPTGSRWELENALPDLLAACAAVTDPNAFILLTAHSTELIPSDLTTALEVAFGIPAEPEAGDLELVAINGAVLPLGVAARMIRR